MTMKSSASKYSFGGFRSLFVFVTMNMLNTQQLYGTAAQEVDEFYAGELLCNLNAAGQTSQNPGGGNRRSFRTAIAAAFNSDPSMDFTLCNNVENITANPSDEKNNCGKNAWGTDTVQECARFCEWLSEEHHFVKISNEGELTSQGPFTYGCGGFTYDNVTSQPGKCTPSLAALRGMTVSDIENDVTDYGTCNENDKVMYYGRKGPQPTAAPVTSSPTMPPSKSPSVSPTKNPTSAVPSTSPSTSPTHAPTKSPTDAPSSSLPTRAPSTTKPTESPSVSPTKNPTVNPTNNPTSSVPTKTPTTPRPTTTSYPTQYPTQIPTTSLPTAVPSALPTRLPSKIPTTQPTTNHPTANPSSSHPTNSPTLSPTTSVPTNNPSTSFPTNDPTFSPTFSPSTSPTQAPTTSPTITPTVAPSQTPTTSPSSSPTLLPSISPSKPSQASDSVGVGVGAGVAVGVILVIVLIVVLIVLLARGKRKKTDKKKSTYIDGLRPENGMTVEEVVVKIPRSNSTSSKDQPQSSLQETSLVESSAVNTGIGVDNIAFASIDTTHRNNTQFSKPTSKKQEGEVTVEPAPVTPKRNVNITNETFASASKSPESTRVAPLDVDGFDSLPTNAATEADLPEGVTVKTMNRYKNILPNAHSRVVLDQIGDDVTSSYINANFITSFDGTRKKEFIAAQGPKVDCVIPFWRMLWQERVKIVIMVTGLVENKKQKCTRYWPDAVYKGSGTDGLTKYGDITVAVMSAKQRVGFKVAELEAYYNGETRTIMHFWFDSWPDFGVPSSSDAVLSMLKMAHATDSDRNSAPWLIHCSAGIGRTGTFIGIEIGMQLIDALNAVDTLLLIRHMRHCRGGMVQTADQYEFLHNVLNDYYMSKKQRSGAITMGENIYGNVTVNSDEKVVYVNMDDRTASENIYGNVDSMPLDSVANFYKGVSVDRQATQMYNDRQLSGRRARASFSDERPPSDVASYEA